MPKCETRTRLQTVDEAAEQLFMHPRTVRRLIAEKKLVAHRFGRALRVAQADLDAFVKGHREP